MVQEARPPGIQNQDGGLRVQLKTFRKRNLHPLMLTMNPQLITTNYDHLFYVAFDYVAYLEINKLFHALLKLISFFRAVNISRFFSFSCLWFAGLRYIRRRTIC